MNEQEIEQKVMEICGWCDVCRGLGLLSESTTVPYQNGNVERITYELCPACEKRAIEILEEQDNE